MMCTTLKLPLIFVYFLGLNYLIRVATQAGEATITRTTELGQPHSPSQPSTQLKPYIHLYSCDNNLMGFTCTVYIPPYRLCSNSPCSQRHRPHHSTSTNRSSIPHTSSFHYRHGLAGHGCAVHMQCCSGVYCGQASWRSWLQNS